MPYNLSHCLIGEDAGGILALKRCTEDAQVATGARIVVEVNCTQTVAAACRTDLVALSRWERVVPIVLYSTDVTDESYHCESDRWRHEECVAIPRRHRSNPATSQNPCTLEYNVDMTAQGACEHTSRQYSAH